MRTRLATRSRQRSSSATYSVDALARGLRHRDDDMIARWLERVDTLGRRARVVAVIALFAAIATTDAVTGLDLTLRGLYLLPVGAAAWLISRPSAFLVGGLSVAVSSYYDIALGLDRTHRGFVYSDAVVRLSVYFAAAAVLSELRLAQARLRELSQTDPLTGLYNRRGLERVADREISRSLRNGSTFTVVQIDLDGFKALNDRLGHGQGDDVLVAVGNTLRSGRAADVAARLGGDEFAVLLPDTDAAHAESAVRRLASRLDEAMAARRWPITFSIGVATFREPTMTLGAMLAVADELMYEVKRAGKAGVRSRDVGPNGVERAS